MSKVIPFSQLARQQHLNFLGHKRREYQERENYLASLRKLLFQIEAQMRQAEILQLDLFHQTAKHFQVPLAFPGLRDRMEMHQHFTESPFLLILTEFFQGRLSPEECCQKIMDLAKESPSPEK